MIVRDQFLGAFRVLLADLTGKRCDRTVLVGTLAAREPRKTSWNACGRQKRCFNPPALRQLKRVEQRTEQRKVTEAQTEREAPRRIPSDRQAHDLRVGLSRSATPKFSRPAWRNSRGRRRVGPRLIAEGRPVIAIARFDVGGRVALDIDPRDGYGQVGAQAQFLAVGIGEDIGAVPYRLADPVEEHFGGLDDGRRDRLVAGPREQIDRAPPGLRAPRIVSPIPPT